MKLDQPVRTSKRTCHYCGREYRAPVGGRRDGCPTCAPSLLERELEPEPGACTCLRLIESSDPPPVHSPDCPLYDGIPF